MLAVCSIMQSQAQQATERDNLSAHPRTRGINCLNRSKALNVMTTHVRFKEKKKIIFLFSSIKVAAFTFQSLVPGS